MKPDGMSKDKARTACYELGVTVKAEMNAKGISDPDIVDAEVHKRWEVICKKKYPQGLDALRPKPPATPLVPTVPNDVDEDDIEPPAEELGMPVMET